MRHSKTQKRKAGSPALMPKTARNPTRKQATGRLLALAGRDLPPPVVTGRRNMMPQMRLARRLFHGKRGIGQKIVGAVHPALGRRFLVLLNSHFNTPENKINL
jgi:hypothetical protein